MTMVGSLGAGERERELFGMRLVIVEKPIFLVRTRTLSREAVLFSKPQRATDTFQLCLALKAATANGRCRHHHLSAQTFHSTALYSKLFSGSTAPTPSSLASSNSYLRCCQNGRNRGGNANQRNSLDETQIASIVKKTPHHLHCTYLLWNPNVVRPLPGATSVHGTANTTIMTPSSHHHDRQPARLAFLHLRYRSLWRNTIHVSRFHVPFCTKPTNGLSAKKLWPMAP